MPTKWEVNKAVRASGLTPPSRLIMLTLSDIAEAGTAEVPARHTPSLKVLAVETGLNEATVKRHLAALDDAGWLKRTAPTMEASRRGERTRYQLLVPIGQGAQSAHPEGAEDTYPEEPGRTERPPQGAQSAHPGRTERPIEGEPDLDDLNDPSSPATPTTATKPPAKKGTRLPDDFHATAEMIEWARKETPLVGAKETATFIDYWRAQPGQRGVKLDWPATWRNWMRRAQADAESRAQRGQPRASPPSNAPVAIPTAEQCPQHRGQRAANCRICASNRKAAPR